MLETGGMFLLHVGIMQFKMGEGWGGWGGGGGWGYRVILGQKTKLDDLV